MDILDEIADAPIHRIRRPGPHRQGRGVWPHSHGRRHGASQRAPAGARHERHQGHLRARCHEDECCWGLVPRAGGGVVKALPFAEVAKGRDRRWPQRFCTRAGLVVGYLSYSLAPKRAKKDALAADEHGHYWHGHETNGKRHCTRKVYTNSIIGVAS